MNADQVRKVAVLGAGVMGHGIGQVAAVAGYSVAIRDIKQEFLDNGEAGIKRSLSRSVERGRMSQEEMEAALSKITFTLDLAEAVSDAQLVIEAIPERMDIKHLVWKEVAEKAPKDAILASNTSSLSITKIAEVVPSPERFIGMHFFNPAVIMKLVEVNQGDKTSQETIDTVIELAKRMGKIPVWVKKDAPGFIVNRVLVTYLNDAAKLLDKYTVEQIDAAMQHKAGMPLGPFMLSDLIGLDIVYHILKVFEAEIGSGYAPHSKITELFEAKKLGRKTKEGFYNYVERPAVTEDQAKGFDVKLLLEPFVAEAEKVVAEGIASEEDVDTAMKLGANIPKGPFEMKKAGLGEEKPVLTDTKDGVLTITLNRPGKLNSMTLEMLEMIGKALEKAGKNKSIRCILFKGAGDRAFCAGADITQFPDLNPAGGRKVSETGHRIYKKIMETPKPVVAAIQGYCLGGGNELIQFCDFRLASEKARFSQPEVTLGLIPGWGGTYMLPKLIGKTLAVEMIMTGRRINAEEAKAAGLVNEVYPVGEFDAKVDEYVKNLVAGPPIALASMKKLIHSDAEMDAALRAEADAFSALWNHDELKEGIDAFNTRRKPEFKDA
ncbi:MAG: 3-hydroxyacyl-CoA dehydrogenase NAD-binding domain-containing protein [Candidatus Bathyarchaeota archaeon]|nr:3-hydroxyacyl-CoA dehydrogenase NAD-binding domain-containing protein [Candidatus Bathyarchaeota archaeon]